jgi:hypothetical protein
VTSAVGSPSSLFTISASIILSAVWHSTFRMGLSPFFHNSLALPRSRSWEDTGIAVITPLWASLVLVTTDSSAHTLSFAGTPQTPPSSAFPSSHRVIGSPVFTFSLVVPGSGNMILHSIFLAQSSFFLSADPSGRWRQFHVTSSPFSQAVVASLSFGDSALAGHSLVLIRSDSPALSDYFPSSCGAQPSAGSVAPSAIM